MFQHARRFAPDVPSLVREILPYGTRPSSGDLAPRTDEDSWRWLPLWPPDVFAVAASLADRSGCYSHPFPRYRLEGQAFKRLPTRLDARARRPSSPPSSDEGGPEGALDLTDRERGELMRGYGACWRLEPQPTVARHLGIREPVASQIEQLDFTTTMRRLQEQWAVLMSSQTKLSELCADEALRAALLELMWIADEACAGLGKLASNSSVFAKRYANLVIALLMDGPQTTHRWSARYATVLADDPGSSVITLTSAGMVRRSYEPGDSERLCVGLWKDSSGMTKELVLPADAHGLLLSIARHKIAQFTLDDRWDGAITTQLELAGIQAIRYAGRPAAASPQAADAKNSEPDDGASTDLLLERLSDEWHARGASAPEIPAVDTRLHGQTGHTDHVGYANYAEMADRAIGRVRGESGIFPSASGERESAAQAGEAKAVP